MKALNWLKAFLHRRSEKESMLTKAAELFGLTTSVGSAEFARIREWAMLYQGTTGYFGNPPEPVHNVLRLPSSIAGEIARTAMIEFKGKISASQEKTENYLNEQFLPVAAKLSERKLKAGCGMGTLVMKPWFCGNKILVDFSGPDGFLPTSLDGSENITGGIFADRIVRDGYTYTKLEAHQFFTDGRYQIRSRAFRSYGTDNYGIGAEIRLGTVSEWSGILPELTLDGIEHPLFGVFRFPNASTDISENRVFGHSCFDASIPLIAQAEEQWSRILWEYEASELALDVPNDLLKIKAGIPSMPKGKQRLYRMYQHDPDNGEMPIQVFSPAIRDSSLFRGLDEIFKRIEFTSGLSYGLISNPQTVEMTATEIINSKQRFHSTVKSVQDELGNALQQLVYGMGVWARYSQGISADGITITLDWDDSILVDRETKRQIMIQDVRDGIIPKWMYAKEFYGMSEEDAKKMTNELNAQQQNNRIMGFEE